MVNHFVCDGGRTEIKAELCVVQLTFQGVDMDVLLVRNEAEGVGQGVDRVKVQRDALVGPLFRMDDGQIASMARRPLDGSRVRGVVEALTRFVEQQHTTANQAVRLFKVSVIRRPKHNRQEPLLCRGICACVDGLKCVDHPGSSRKTTRCSGSFCGVGQRRQV